jgi:hypothetical protein
MTKLIFYTYKYVWEDGTPYYVGKGKENRAFKDHGEIPVPKDRNRIIFLIENVSEKEAFQHEKEMIKFYGRKDLGTGPLLNKTSGGQGTSCRVITEEDREWRRKAGNKNKENKTGIFGRSPEKHSEDSRKGGKIGGLKGGKTTSIQKWQCTETGYVSNAGGLTCYQKARGIDTSNRIKLDSPRSWEITFEDGRIIIITQTLKKMGRRKWL